MTQRPMENSVSPGARSSGGTPCHWAFRMRSEPFGGTSESPRAPVLRMVIAGVAGEDKVGVVMADSHAAGKEPGKRES